MLNLIRKLCKSIVLTAFTGLLVSWSLPENYKALKESKNATLLLDYVIVSINGEAKKVSRNEELSFVRGDILNVSQAYLKDSQKVIKLVEISGFEDAKSGLEVRNHNIDSSLNLVQPEGSLDPNGTVYALLAQSGETLHGAIFLRRVEPSLSYIDVLINGKNRVMREGETLQVKKTDHFKIVNVVTNVRDNKDVSFAVIPIVGGKKTTGENQNYHILFRQKAYVFAKIPLTIESL